VRVPFRLPGWSLRVRLVSLLLLASLLPLALSAYVDIRQRQAQLLDDMEEVLQARADQLVRELDSFHRAHQRSVDRLARSPDTAAFCAADDRRQAVLRGAMSGLLAAFPASDPAIGGAALLDRNGTVLIATNPAIKGADLRFRPHVRSALQGEAAIADLHLTLARAGEQPAITYLMPLRGADQQVTCVALLLVRAKGIWDIVKASHGLAGPDSFAVLLDPLGIRIAHTNSDEIVFHPTGALDAATVDQQVAERRFGTRTRALLEDVRAFPEQFERARASSPDLSVFRGIASVDQTLHYGVARRFDVVPWTLFYMSPAANIEAQITRMTLQKSALAGGIIVLALGVGLFVASGIVRPVRALTAATASVAGGDLSTRVGDVRGDELGRLGASFNAMAERIEQQSSALQRARDGLEQRVQERTAELTRTAERLQAEVVERERAEAANRESQQLLQAIIDNTPAVIYVKDVQGRYLMVNRRYSELFHLRGDAVIGKSDRELFPAETAAAVAAVDQRVLEAQAPVTEEEVMPHDDGPHTYLSVKAPLRDEHGSVHGVIGISTDITDRKHAEVRLQAQFERLNLLDQITSAIGERQDLQSIYQVAVRSLEERLPVDFCCVCRYDAVEEMLTVTRVGVHSEALAMELAMSERSAVPIDENGLSRCVQGHLVYEADIASIAFPFPQRLARRGLRSLVVAPLQSESRVFGVLVAARLQPNAFSSGECEFVRQLSAHVALAAQQAELHGSLQRAYDDLRQTQQAVMQQERLRALGQMASGIAHDINNAISPISLYTESLLEREPGLSAEARSSLQTIARAIEDVAATVARMREFYRQREPKLSHMPLSLNLLVQQVAELTRARWSDMPQQRGIVIRLRTDLDADLPQVMGTESEIREALINLVFNAVDAMPEGGELTLRTRAVAAPDSGAGASCAQLEVEDTGLGMDEDTRRRCLEPFFTTKGERGTGLGLAMVYGAAQRHGADIDIRSAPGHGTTIALRFPTPAVMASDGPVAPATADAPAQRLRVLLVDDDPLLLRTLQDMLEADGHAVVAMNGGQAGIDAFNAMRAAGEAFSLVLTDLGMPYVDGRKVANAVKQASPGTPVVLLTGWGQRLVADGDIPESVDHVLSKPPKLSELRQALARHGRPVPVRTAT
jgi:PAS domain S-box-containing protein